MKPNGPEDLTCPLHKKRMSKVCSTCPFWTHIRGLDPNTGTEIDRWNCAIAWLPTLLLENAQQSRQTGAAVESFRNEVVEANNVRTMVEGVARRLTHG